MSFWQQLEKPILAVAPMADVTDAAFRRLIAKYSGWDALNNVVMWTEFVTADGLMRATPEGKAKIMADLAYGDEERPIVAQLFTSIPEHMEGAARLCAELGFDGVDINMGCPVKVIGNQGAGAAMITNPENAVRVIEAAKRGAGDLPVSVKTRIGYLEDEIETWIPTLLQQDLAALTVHLRTKKEMSKVPAQWEKMPQIVALRDTLAPETLIIGNGDVLSQADAQTKIIESGADGAMIGRGLFGNPWFFNPHRQLPTQLSALPTHGVDRDSLVTERTASDDSLTVSLEERLAVLVEHTRLFVELLPFKSFAVMKKHFKAYVSGFAGAAELRAALMSTNTPEEVEVIVHDWLAAHSDQC